MKQTISNSVNAEANAVKVVFEKPEISFFKRVTQNVVTITAEDKDKLISDFLGRQELASLIKEKVEEILNDIPSKRLIGESLNCLAIGHQNDYEIRKNILGDLLLKKLSDIGDNRAHYLVTEAVESLKNLSGDETRYLAAIVFTFSYSPVEGANSAVVVNLFKETMNKVLPPETMLKTNSYGNHILQRLDRSGLIVKNIPKSIWNQKPEEQMMKWLCCSKENLVEEVQKIGYDDGIIAAMKNIGDVSDLGSYLGYLVLKNLGINCSEPF